MEREKDTLLRIIHRAWMELVNKRADPQTALFLHLLQGHLAQSCWARSRPPKVVGFVQVLPERPLDAARYLRHLTGWTRTGLVIFCAQPLDAYFPSRAGPDSQVSLLRCTSH